MLNKINRSIIQEDNNAEDITKLIPKSNSKIDDLRENRIGEIINKSTNAGKQVSDNIIKVAEERNDKKRKERKKKNIDEDVNLNNTINNDKNTANLENMSKEQLLSYIKNMEKNNNQNLTDNIKAKEKKVPKKDLSAKDEPKKGFKSTTISSIQGAE